MPRQGIKSEKRNYLPGKGTKKMVEVSAATIKAIITHATFVNTRGTSPEVADKCSGVKGSAI